MDDLPTLDDWNSVRRTLGALQTAQLRRTGLTMTAFARRQFFWRPFIILIFQLTWFAFAVVSNTWLLRAVVDFVETGGDAHVGVLLAVGFFASDCVKSAAINQHWWQAVQLGTQLRAFARALIFEKACRLRPGAAAIGTTVNLVANDAQRLLEASNFGIFIVSAPIILGIILVIMFIYLGPSVLAGLLVVLIVFPVQWRIGRKTAQVCPQPATSMTNRCSYSIFVE